MFSQKAKNSLYSPPSLLILLQKCFDCPLTTPQRLTMGQSYRAKKPKSIKKNKNNRITSSNKILDLLTASMCILACFDHFLLPSPFLEPCINHFLSITLPHMKSTFLQPTCVFVVVNVIIVFLIAQSMLGPSPTSSADDLYDEYVNLYNRGRKDLKVYDSVPKEKNNKEREPKEDYISEGHGDEEVGPKRTGKLLKGKVVEDEEEEGEEEKEELPAEELNEEVEAKGTRKLLEEEEEEEELPAEELNEEVGAKGTGKLLEEGKLEEEEEELPADELNEEAGAIGARRSLEKGTTEEEEKELPTEKLNEEAGAKGTRKLLEKGGVEEEEEEEEEELPTEELNRRIEAFIHRINKRRLLEARS